MCFPVIAISLDAYSRSESRTRISDRSWTQQRQLKTSTLKLHSVGAEDCIPSKLRVDFQDVCAMSEPFTFDLTKGVEFVGFSFSLNEAHSVFVFESFVAPEISLVKFC